MKRIMFSVTDQEFQEINTKAMAEGLKPSSYAKRKTIMSLKVNYSWDEKVCETIMGQIKFPGDVVGYLGEIKDKVQEHVMVLSLNAQNQIVNQHIVTIGTANSSQIHPREIFAPAITDRATAIIVAHNHPSGCPTPSPEDIAITRRIMDAGKIIGIQVHDHIIIGSGEGKICSIITGNYI